MHLIATIPGGWSPGGGGIFSVEQTPGDIVFLSAADTDISCLNSAYAEILSNKKSTGTNIPSLRMANLAHLKHELSVDGYVDSVISGARLVVARMLGGKNYYPYVCDSLFAECGKNGVPLAFLPGDDSPDAGLMSMSTAPPEFVRAAWDYFSSGGAENCGNFLKLAFNTFFDFSLKVRPPQKTPDIFLFDDFEKPANKKADAAIVAYRSLYFSANLSPVAALARALAARGFASRAVFVKSLREREDVAALEKALSGGGFDIIFNTTSFALKGAAERGGFIFEKLGLPVFQAVFASCPEEAWRENLFGLSPTDMAINISLPEMDGKIDAGPVCFKRAAEKDPATDSEIVAFAPCEDGCRRAAALGDGWLALKQKNNAEKKIALIMPNYPSRDGRLANGVGLDTPESCARILEALRRDGYRPGEKFPRSGKEIIDAIASGVTNEPDFMHLRESEIILPLEDFLASYRLLSPEMRGRIEKQWGEPEKDPHISGGGFPLPGRVFGNIFISIQPERGYGQDTKAVYHSPDIPPPPRYLAFYFWVFRHFNTDAVIHLGKHGNLEWLPGKSVALSPETCFPAAVFPPVPHFYPFIINDPGEGSQAKRRARAVIIDHMIPPMVRAGGYGDYLRLEQILDEYWQALGLDPERAEFLRREMGEVVEKTRIYEDLGCPADDLDEVAARLDAYLCEIKESQIRGGLHILGQPPEGEPLAELLVALHRIGAGGLPGITRALASDMGLGFDPVDCDYGAPFNGEICGKTPRTLGAAVEELEEMAKNAMSRMISDRSTGMDTRHGQTPTHTDGAIADHSTDMDTVDAITDGATVQSPLADRPVINRIDGEKFPAFSAVCAAVLRDTLPRLERCPDEISNLLAGLRGKYVPSGPSGAPTRGRPDILPTGRNFHSVDTRGLPTRAAYALGKKSADALIARHLQDEGEYPSAVGISVWGTSTMRTGGDDMAQAFALLGLRPVWQGESGRVTDFEVVSLAELGRPRVDVTLRISGFFRDAFPDLISLFNHAVEKVAAMDDEPPEMNPLRRRHLSEKSRWMTGGLDEREAGRRSLYRVFGSKPGSYGAGLQSAIDSKNWRAPEDLAMIYVNWSGYAYGADGPRSAHEAYGMRLAAMDIVVQNQDNREHDILDSDDYYQFHGGMANAARTAKKEGGSPAIYFGDNSRPENPKIRTLKEELLRVYRSRAVNPKWIEAMRRHGYKGAFEMAATVDYLFGYDALTGVVEDFVYEGVAEAYLFDGENFSFLKENNPRAAAEMAERMLEAAQRGMWKNPGEKTLERLRAVFTEAEAVCE